MHVLHLLLGFDGRRDARDFPTLTRLVEEQAALGARVTVLGRAMRNDEETRNGVRYLLRADDPSLYLPRRFTRLTPLWNVVAELAPDVIHFNGLVFPLQLSALRRHTRAAMVAQHHGGPPMKGLKGIAQRRALRSADALLFTGKEQGEAWRVGRPVHELLEASSDFLPVPRAEARKTTGLAGHPDVLWVGRLSPRKDPLTALQAFHQAAGRVPDARLTLVFGEAPLLDELGPLLTDRVRVVGKVPHHELPAWYSAADLFLTTSPEEGSNYALIEALSCGLYSVASDIPPHRAISGNGASATLFPVGDVDACAAALSSGVRRQRDAIRADFEARLSWPVVGRRSLAIYEDVVARRVVR